MGRPLIAPAWRRPAMLAALLGFAVFLSLAVLTFHAKFTGFDRWAFRVLPEHISPSHTDFLIGFTEPALSVLLLALTVVLAASVRRLDLVVLAVLGPTLGTVLASDLAKPAIHRTMFTGTVGTYPSGHETGVACTAMVLLVAFGQLPLRRAAKWALAAVLAAWVIVAALGLTRFYYHYATDTIGAVGLSIAVVFGLAALLDRYWLELGRLLRDRLSLGRFSLGRFSLGRLSHGRLRLGRPSVGRLWLRRPARRRLLPERPSAPEPHGTAAPAPEPARPLPHRRPRPVPVDDPDPQLTPRA